MKEQLSVSVLRQGLQAWWRDRHLPPVILNALTPQTTTHTAIYRSVIAFDALHSIGHAYLNHHRASLAMPTHATPETVDDLTHHLQDDFSHTVNDQLLAWSAVYHRYLVAIRPPQSTLVRWAGVSPRQMRRYVSYGLAALTAAVIQDRL